MRLTVEKSDGSDTSELPGGNLVERRGNLTEVKIPVNLRRLGRDPAHSCYEKDPFRHGNGSERLYRDGDDGVSNQSVHRALAAHDGTHVSGSEDGRAGLLSSAT